MQAVLATSFVVAFFLMNQCQEWSFRKRQLDSRGDLPIARGPFVLAKLSMVLAWLSILVECWVLDLRVVALGPSAPWVAVGLEALGIAVIAAGYVSLGNANQMGLTRHPTHVRTGGVYRMSRNPIYLGFHLLSAAAVLYTANPLVLVLATTSVALHHRIVLAEERHLDRTLGAEFRAYRARVRRYL